MDWTSLMSAIPVSSDPPQHIPQVPALERSSVAAMVPGIWGLAIWGPRIDWAVHVQWQLVEHSKNYSWETKQLFQQTTLFSFMSSSRFFKALMTTVSLCDRSWFFREDFYWHEATRHWKIDIVTTNDGLVSPQCWLKGTLGIVYKQQRAGVFNSLDCQSTWNQLPNQ